MSNLTGTINELRSVSGVAGTALANSASAAVLNPASAAGYFPVAFWEGGPMYRSWRVTSKGVYSTAASGNPTLQVGVTLDSAQGTTGALTFLSGATVVIISAASWFWEMDVELTAQAVTETSGAGTVNIVGIGTLTLHRIALPGTFTQGTTVNADRIPIGASATVAQSMTAGFFIETYAKWGSAVAGTSIQALTTRVYGEN